MRQRSVGIASELECAQDGQVMVARGPDMRPSLSDVEPEDPLHVISIHPAHPVRSWLGTACTHGPHGDGHRAGAARERAGFGVAFVWVTHSRTIRRHVLMILPAAVTMVRARQFVEIFSPLLKPADSCDRQTSDGVAPVMPGQGMGWLPSRCQSGAVSK